MFLREGNVICLLSARPSSEAMYQRWEYNVEAHSGDILRTEDLLVVHNELLCLEITQLTKSILDVQYGQYRRAKHIA